MKTCFIAWTRSMETMNVHQHASRHPHLHTLSYTRIHIRTHTSSFKSATCPRCIRIIIVSWAAEHVAHGYLERSTNGQSSSSSHQQQQQWYVSLGSMRTLLLQYVSPGSVWTLLLQTLLCFFLDHQSAMNLPGLDHDHNHCRQFLLCVVIFQGTLRGCPYYVSFCLASRQPKTVWLWRCSLSVVHHWLAMPRLEADVSW